MSSWNAELPRVLIADDDRDLLNIAALVFRQASFEAVTVETGTDALQSFYQHRFDLVVLDVNMPAPDGLQVCAQIRQRSNVPVLVLSAGDTENDLLRALDAGADMYLVKPFSPRTLIARVQALLRRAAATEAEDVMAGHFKLEAKELRLSFPGGELPLTKLETKVLRALVANAGKTVSAADLITEVWDTSSSAHRNMLKQVIFRLRRKLSTAPDAFNALRTTSSGYMWSDVERRPAESGATG